jgi:starvation-inducible DNA-binding protein
VFATRIDIPAKQRAAVIELLNARLADELDLKLQAKQAHWNVKGPNFIALHEQFDKTASSLDEPADSIAERVAALGGEAQGTLGIVAERTKIKAYPLGLKTGQAHVQAISDGLATLAKSVRESIARSNEIGDLVTADLFTQVAGELDKTLWFVEAHLQAER